MPQSDRAAGMIGDRHLIMPAVPLRRGEAIVTFDEGDTLDEEYAAWASTNREIYSTCAGVF